MNQVERKNYNHQVLPEPSSLYATGISILTGAGGMGSVPSFFTALSAPSSRTGKPELARIVTSVMLPFFRMTNVKITVPCQTIRRAYRG